MAKTYQVLAILLSYPTAEIQAAAPELAEVLRHEALLPPPHMDAARAFIDEIGTGDLLDLQERYVGLFDRSRALSLHLFEHVHGESRDRGQAMVDLGALYERHGLHLSVPELPDHLPVFLEFLSVLPEAEARDLLARPAHVIAALGDRLAGRDAGYAAVFQALMALTPAVAAHSEAPGDDPDDPAALDRAWEDAAVVFGPDPSACRPAAGAAHARPDTRRPSTLAPDGR